MTRTSANFGKSALRRIAYAPFALALLALLAGSQAFASQSLENALKKIQPAELLEGAQRYAPHGDEKRIVAIEKNGRKIGYAFLNTDFDSAIGYSGKPIKILVAMDVKGRITGAKMTEHSEPIVLAGVPEEKIIKFINGYKGLDMVEIAAGEQSRKLPEDIVSGATVTVLVIDDSIRNASIQAARLAGIKGMETRKKHQRERKTIDESVSEKTDWLGMIGDGAVRRLKITVGEINDAFEKTGNRKAIRKPEPGEENDVFIELFAASLAAPAIAGSLLGEDEYENLQEKIKPGENAFLIMGNGPFSFKGSGYVRGGIFDRIQLVQNRSSIRFRDRGHKRIAKINAEGAPQFREAGIFKTTPDAKFDPASPWRLQLLVPRATGALDKAFVTYELGYRLPEKYLKVEETQLQPLAASASDSASGPASASASDPAPADGELWMRIWERKAPQAIILATAISFLTVLFFFQNHLVRHPRLTRWIRDGFLAFTLVWIGWYAQAQLSVVNVFVFANALIGDFRWEYFLLEPLIFILWCSVAASLLFWGRGAFCGWLCPFGALQELLNRIARAVKIPQYRLPWGVHERIWPLKYLIFLALLGISIHSLAYAERLAEIEPFKTAIVLRFQREWFYVAFVLVLLGAGLFVERFYCRYLCPLGAALAIPGKLAMFDWLKRYRNCGDPCHLCAQDCMVQAITPLGDINPNECLHCLNCQVKYFDKEVCPVMILKHSKSGKPDAGGGEAESLEGARSLFRRPRRLGKPREIEADAPIST